MKIEIRKVNNPEELKEIFDNLFKEDSREMFEDFLTGFKKPRKKKSHRKVSKPKDSSVLCGKDVLKTTENCIKVAPLRKPDTSSRQDDLLSTVDDMKSADYKKRFTAEYNQVRIRYEKLKKMVEIWDANKLHFKPTCPRSLYDIQLRIMEDYLDILKTRASIEGIEL